MVHLAVGEEQRRFVIDVDPDEALNLDKGYVQRYWAAHFEVSIPDLFWAASKVGATPRALAQYFQEHGTDRSGSS